MSLLSVAMCTCEGERFLPEQLASIAAQSRAPDELVVCDDASTDRTVALLREFAARAPFAVRIEVNPQRLGVAGNFDRAIGECRGDLIALADQDDVWLPERLARGEDALVRDPGAALVFSDAEVVDERLEPLGYGLWQASLFDAEDQDRVRAGDALGVLLRRPVVTGATATMRASLRELVRPIDRRWIHDGWIAMLVAATGRMAMLPERLMLYRQHSANQVGSQQRGWGEQLQRSRRSIDDDRLARGRERYAAVAERLRERGAGSREALGRINDAVAHLGVRTSLAPARWRRLAPVMREVVAGRYGRYSRGWASAAHDLVL